MPTYPDIEVQLTGEDGNAFAIMGRVARELRKHKIEQKVIDEYTNKAMSGDYGNLLRTTAELVTVL